MEGEQTLKIRNFFKQYGKRWILLGITILIYLVFKILRPDNFGNPANLFSYFQQALLPTVAACGFYFIIVMGLFDFSLGANIV